MPVAGALDTPGFDLLDKCPNLSLPSALDGVEQVPSVERPLRLVNDTHQLAPYPLTLSVLLAPGGMDVQGLVDREDRLFQRLANALLATDRPVAFGLSQHNHRIDRSGPGCATHHLINNRRVMRFSSMVNHHQMRLDGPRK